MAEPDPITAVIDLMFSQCLAMYGPAVKSLWFHESDLCPCCAQRSTRPIQGLGEAFVSVNAFFYRERSVLIGYLLCGTCAANILEAPATQQEHMHDRIEACLKQAYQLAGPV